MFLGNGFSLCSGNLATLCGPTASNAVPTAPLKLVGPSIGNTMYCPGFIPHFFNVSPKLVRFFSYPNFDATSVTPKNPNKVFINNLAMEFAAFSIFPCRV